MRTLRVISWVLAGMAPLLGTPTDSLAQNYPNQVVRVVVPFSAGSITDGLARILADKLAEMWKQQVIVENRPGLPGTTGVAKSPPDGYTLMLTSNGHTIAGAINKNIQFDPVKDFAGVSRVASVPLVAIVPPELPAKTLKEFIALAKERPGQLNFSSAGVASTSYLSAEIFKQDADINIVHIPYKGAPEATTAVIRNDAQMYFAPIPATQELTATGKVRALAINSAKRVPQLPDVPTVAETLPKYKYESWFGVFACIERIKQMSSACWAVFAKISLISMPLWPYGWNLKGEGRTVPNGRSVVRFPVGMVLSAHLARAGLGSNVSTWDGPPLR